MKTIILPSEDNWPLLCKRPSVEKSEIEKVVRQIIDDVKSQGDNALLYYSEKFDKIKPGKIKVPRSEIERSASLVSEELKESISIAKRNIERFHSSQILSEPVIETMPGIKCWRKSVPIEKVGIYIPGGTAPLFSTVLMLAIPARIAGCKEIVICTPAGRDGCINPLILYTSGLLGVSDIYKVGGAQAIAAMAYGTETIRKVNKIFGPGNQYVTKAKELIQQEGISIDLPAGPSEVLIIGDKSANPEFIASDLLSQAEHGTDSQVILLSDSKDLISKTALEIEKQLKNLPRHKIAAGALENSTLILLKSIDDCVRFSNIYAPEHLILNCLNFQEVSGKIINAGSVFLGKFSCESAGDYASGTNHTLPTNGYARSYSGVSSDSFIKKITFQELSEEGLKNIGPAIINMAEAESLRAHGNAVKIRLKN
jgi:histidinol dehydrogenase